MKTIGQVVIVVLSLALLQAEQSYGQQRRVERNVRQLNRQAARMINRADYYTTDAWTQVNPWVTQYELRPLGPVQRTVARAADAVAATNRTMFGFNDVNAQPADVWFYDYYTYWPSYYTTADASANAYASAIRYYDFDNDGIYESSYSYRDSDHDGQFDEYDRFDYTSVDAKDDVDHSPQDAKRHSVSGKIDSQKMARVNNTDFVIVRVKQDDGSSVVVDLGPKDRWAQVKLQENDSIKATGPMERIGEKDVLMAEVVFVGDKEYHIDRPMASYTGTVREVKQFKVHDADHTLAVIETADGNQLVDLGPAGSLKVDLTPKEKIVVYGVPVRMHDHQVVMASRFDLGGQTHAVVRWK